MTLALAWGHGVGTGVTDEGDLWIHGAHSTGSAESTRTTEARARFSDVLSIRFEHRPDADEATVRLAEAARLA